MNETAGRTIAYIEMDSLIGPFTLAATEEGLCALTFGKWEQNQEYLFSWSKRWFGECTWKYDPEILADAKQQLNQYFAGEREQFNLKLDLHGTPFQLQVWQALQTVPYGQTASYKDIAIAINSPKAVRAVGGANNRNPISIIIPCHRVIGADGKLIGYGGGLDIKQILLQLETAPELSIISEFD
jgi:O-6-methylguanine DNA methyltransferase